MKPAATLAQETILDRSVRHIHTLLVAAPEDSFALEALTDPLLGDIINLRFYTQIDEILTVVWEMANNIITIARGVDPSRGEYLEFTILVTE